MKRVYKTRKVFIGMVDIASQITDFKEGFQANGVDTLTAIYANYSKVSKGKADVNLSLSKKRYFGGIRPRFLQKYLQDNFGEPHTRLWKRAIRECDTFLFIWSSFQKDFSDLAELKRKGKKIISVFVGSDVRWYHAMKQDFTEHKLPLIEYDEINTSPEELKNTLSRLRIAEKYSDIIICLPCAMQLALKPYMKYMILVNCREIVENTKQREINPIVIHAPTHQKGKGTQYVLEVFDRLKKEGIVFEVRLIENMANEQALKEYSNADILVGQLLTPGGGKQDREAMAAGTIVLSSFAKDYPQLLPECPIIDVTPATLYRELKSIILDYPRRVELAKKGRPYVEKYHSPAERCKVLLDLLELQEERRSYDFYPEFFKNKFVPESQMAAEIYNTWTDFVKGCDWYKKYVKSKDRNGLKF